MKWNSSEREVQSNEHGRVEVIGVIEEIDFGGAYFMQLFSTRTIDGTE